MRLKTLVKAVLWTLGGVVALIVAALAVAVYFEFHDPRPRSTVSIPFEFKDAQVFVTATLNGKPVRAQVDTGAPTSVLDITYARSLGLPLKVSGGSANGQSAHHMDLSDYTLMLGGRKIVGLAVTDMSGFRGIEDAPLLLGVKNVFTHRVVQLDFRQKQMVLHRRKTFAPPAGAREIRLVSKGFLNRHFARPVSINGGPPILAEIDLGSQGKLWISSDAAKKAGLTLTPGREMRGEGINVKTVSGHATGDVTVAGYPFRQVDIEVAAPGTQFYFDEFEGNLGAGALSAFHVWLDLTGKRMWLLAPTQYLIGLDAPTGLVRSVKSGRPADKAGIKPGDRILTINGAPVESSSKARDRYSPAPVTLVMADGRVLTLTPYAYTPQPM
jgi:hypothetical protein